jgi:uncharacterized RDD family membrane protein YckC
MNETIPAEPISVVQDVTGPRIGAAVIDIILMGILFLVMGMLFGDAESDNSSFSVNLDTGPSLIYFLLVMAYYFFFELTSGQTIGKKLLKVRVVSLDGQPLTPGKVALRTILRIIDGLPIFYLVGFICVLASKQKQRIGDMAAGTAVVRA